MNATAPFPFVLSPCDIFICSSSISRYLYRQPRSLDEYLYEQIVSGFEEGSKCTVQQPPQIEFRQYKL